jgi:serine/threonine protein kinase
VPDYARSRTLDAAVPVQWTGTERYEIVRTLGRGGMGVVYEARDRASGQVLALKTLLNADPDSLYRFKREFRSLADTDHPNLVRLYDFVQDESDRVFFTMELVRGTNFVSYVRSTAPRRSEQPTMRDPSFSRMERVSRDEGSPLKDSAIRAAGTDTDRPRKGQPIADFARLRPALLQVVEGVMALHAARRLHRDIKPSNVLVTEDGRVVILDFGVATELSRAAPNDTDRLGQLVGTAAYVAPEQAFEEPSPASDWYGVGVMLYESIVGRPPFTGSLSQVLAMKMTVDPPRPSERLEGVPSDLDALCHALLQRDSRARPTGPEILERLRGPARVRPEQKELRLGEGAVELVGRAAHLRTLREAFDAARLQGLVAVRVGGGAGMGKSALVQRFVDDLVEQDDALILRGRAYEREAVPYKAIDGVVDSLSSHLTGLSDEDLAVILPQEAWTLARLFPVLRRVPAIDALIKPIDDPQRARRRAFRALRDLFAGLAFRRPVVLFIDDVHWGDTDSAALLLELVRPPDAPPLLLVMTYRDEHESRSPFLAELLDGWPRQVEMREVAVGPLDPEDARRLARATLGTSGVSADATADAIARESQGSPFLVEEIARTALSQSALRTDGSGIAGLGTLEQMVGHRLTELSDDARHCLELVAICGRPVPISVASAACVAAASTEIISLLRARRFVRTGIREGREVVEVLHDRIRETIVTQVPAATVREHHDRLARVLEAVPDPDFDALVTHLLGAGNADRAVQFAEQAAERAAGKLAFDQAAHLLRLAIPMLPASSTDGFRLRKRLGEILEWAGRGGEAGRAYLEAAKVAPASEQLDLQRVAAEQLHASGLMDEGTKVLRGVLEALRVWAPRTPRTSFVWFLLHLFWLRVGGLRFREREVSLDERRKLDAISAVAYGFALVDHILGVAMKMRVLVVAMRMGDRLYTARGAALVALDVATYTGRESGIEHDLRHLSRGLAQKHPAAKLTLAVSHGIALHMRGHFRAAMDVLDPIHLAVTNRRVAVHSAMLWALHSVQFLGEMVELTDRYKRALTDADERGNLFLSVALRTSSAASVWLAADDPDRARRELRDAMAQWGQKGFSSPQWRATVSEAEVDLYVGDPASAYDRVKDLSRVLVKHFFFAFNTRVLVAFAQGRSAIASLDGLAPRARKKRLKDAQHWTRFLKSKRMTFTAPLASILEAGVAFATGDRGKAESALYAAAEAAKVADMALHGAAARYELGLLLGGDEGAELVRAATEAMLSLGVHAPARFAPMLVPGIRSRS